MTRSKTEMAEYIDFKIDDEGLEGVYEHCIDFVTELDEHGDLSERIQTWRAQEVLLVGELRNLIRPHLSEELR